jgi:DNA polymerase-3 subunit delta'
VDLTKQAAESIIKRDEYNLNALLYSLGRERDDVRNTLSMLDMLVRDAAVLNGDRNADNIGCWRDGALRLSEMITASQAMRIHRYIEKAWSTIESNVSIPLATAAMCGEIIGCL